MNDNSDGSGGQPEDRITRALPYVVGLLAAFGLLIYSSTQQDDNGGAAVTTEVASAGPARADVGPVRRALDRPEFAGVEVGEYDGTIVLTGEVVDADVSAEAEAVAVDAADGAPVENRIALLSDAGGPSTTVAGSDEPPATAAASTVAAADAAAADAATTTAAPTTLSPDTTMAAVPATEATVATTLAPETTAPAPAPDTTLVAAPAETTVPPAVELSADDLDAQLSALLRAEPIQFEKLATRVDPVSFGTLDRAVAIIQSSPSARFEVQGHTDSGGQPSFNQRLSEQRASAVRDALVERGVAAERLVAVGYGETRPVARNATPEGRSLNRRVEIVALR